MTRYEAVQKIVDGVLGELRGRSGCDIEQIIDDEGIYTELVDELFEIVDTVVFEYLRDW